jgi:ABC-type bacteriocin/lantibiotic exporter with double-glycine peptidase domain
MLDTNRRDIGKELSAMCLDVPYFDQQTDDTCAPACLRMALAYRFPERDVSESELGTQCHCLADAGCTPNDAFAAAQHYGLPALWLEATRLEAEVETAINEGSPVVAHVELRGLPYTPQPPNGREYWHTVLIVGLDDTRIYLHDPDRIHGGARRTVDRTVFFAGWANHGHSAYRV